MLPETFNIKVLKGPFSWDEFDNLLASIRPGSSSGKELGYGLDSPGSIPGVGGVEIFLHSFVSRLVEVVDMGFTTLSTSQVISVGFYSEREKSDKFCSEALISAWGSFTCCKSTTRDPRLYFLSDGSHTEYCYALKKSIDPTGFEPANLGSSGECDNHGTTRVQTIKWVPGDLPGVKGCWALD